MDHACPCGSGASHEACCAPYLAGAAAPTALALMRSRYAAYVLGQVDYVFATHDPKTSGNVDKDATRKWSEETRWAGLDIVATERGGEDDDEGIVEFVARGETGGQPFVHRERSTFRKLDGRWFFMDGVVPKLVPVTAAATPGRNDPCSCGSGKKYKRCHGA
jgi:SEC-C motif-containing protein